MKTEANHHSCECIDIHNLKGKKVCCLYPFAKKIEISIGGYVTLIQLNEKGKFEILNKIK